MIILHLTAHRPFRPRSLGDIEKATCAAAFVLDSDTIIRAVRPSMVSLGARPASCWPRPSLPNAALLIQQRRRFFVEEDVCGESATNGRRQALGLPVITNVVVASDRKSVVWGWCGAVG